MRHNGLGKPASAGFFILLMCLQSAMTPFLLWQFRLGMRGRVAHLQDVKGTDFPGRELISRTIPLLLPWSGSSFAADNLIVFAEVPSPNLKQGGE